MRYCRNCKNYWFKEFDPFNKECKLGHPTPRFGDTEACPDYDEGFTFGPSTKYCDECKHYSWGGCRKGYDIPRSRQACDEFEE